MEKESALLVVSFGTSYAETRKRTLEAIERDLQDAFANRRFYRAWTSRRIVKKLRETQGVCYDNVQEALERMLQDGITDVLIQPTHMMSGLEFETMKETVYSYRGRFGRMRIGDPLLAGEEDTGKLAEAIETIFAEIKSPDMLALMGHGSGHTDLPVYDLLNERFKKDGFENFCVGTVEFEPGFAQVLCQVREQKPDKVWLAPLLVVAGDHVIHDMAGESKDSWKGQIEQLGMETVCSFRGMGEYQEIRNIYVAHARNAKDIIL